MKTRMIMAAVAAGLTVMASWAAEPAQEVQNAASKLAEKESYSWTATTKLGGESRFEPRPWQGKTAGESGTIITTTGRDDQEIKVAIQGEKRWMKTDEGWQSLAELAQGEQGGAAGFHGAIDARLQAAGGGSKESRGQNHEFKERGKCLHW